VEKILSQAPSLVKMKKSRRIEITIRSRRTVVLKQDSKAFRVYCKRCGEEVWINFTKTGDLGVSLEDPFANGDEKGAKE
jgi:hypothetical protein